MLQHRICRSAGLAAGCVLALCGVSWAQPDPPPARLVDLFLDPSKGVVDGQTAMGVLVGRVGPGGLQEIYPPGSFSVHLRSLEESGAELVYPAGEWFRPPAGGYRIWAVGDWLISPYSRMINYSGSPFRGRGWRILLAAEEGGKVAVAQVELYEPRLELRVLHAGSYSSSGGAPGLELVRRSTLASLGEGIVMPAGLAVAALWDAVKGEYVALARPFEVKPRAVVAAAFERPGRGARLLVEVRRDRILSHSREYGLRAALTAPGQEAIPADMVVEAAEIAYALWYDLPPGEMKLKVESEVAASLSADLTLKAGEIQRLIAEQPPLLDFEDLR